MDSDVLVLVVMALMLPSNRRRTSAKASALCSTPRFDSTPTTLCCTAAPHTSIAGDGANTPASTQEGTSQRQRHKNNNATATMELTGYRTRL
jgi:hypothetical protein